MKASRKGKTKHSTAPNLFSRHQTPGDFLYRFWHSLNGLAALYDFGKNTKTLVLDMYLISEMVYAEETTNRQEW